LKCIKYSCIIVIYLTRVFDDKKGGIIMKNVVIYTSDTCTFCSAAKEYFKENNVSYEEKNVKEPSNRKELMAMGIMSVPVIKIDGETVIGFNQSEVEALLNK